MNRVDDGPALEELFANLAVSADWTMGFLTGICSGPESIPLATWLPEILPDALDDTPTTRKKAELLVRLHGAAAETVASRPEIIPPEPDKPAEDAIEFCRGYLRGARLHEQWRSDEVATQKLAPFVALAKETDDPNPEEATQRERLGAHVAELREYWQSKRQVVNTTPKVGRNDPCPCGSGKKHKKCCLG